MAKDSANFIDDWDKVLDLTSPWQHDVPLTPLSGRNESSGGRNECLRSWEPSHCHFGGMSVMKISCVDSVSEATGSGLSQAGTRRKGLKLPAMQHCLAAALETGFSCWAKQGWHCLLKRNLNQPLVNDRRADRLSLTVPSCFPVQLLTSAST